MKKSEKKIRYEGPWMGFQQYTILRGQAKGATFTVKHPKELKKKIDEVQRRFSK